MSSIDYIVRFYLSNEEKLMEKLFPPWSETYKEHQQTICKRFEEILTFEPGLEIVALKMLGIEQYMFNAQCTDIVYEEKPNGDNNTLFFKNNDTLNIALISHFWKNEKPCVFNDSISFAGNNIFPNMDEENKLQSVDIYCSKVLDFLIEDSPKGIDEVKTVHVSKTKVLVNGSFEFPLDEKIPPRIHGYYYDRRLAGFVIDKFVFYFPDVHIKMEERLMGLILNHGVPERLYKPGNMVMTGVKKVAKKPSEVNSHFPEGRAEKTIDETTWNSFCRKFPDSSFKQYRLLNKEMEEVRKKIKEKGGIDSMTGLLEIFSLLAKHSENKKEENDESNAEEHD